MESGERRQLLFFSSGSWRPAAKLDTYRLATRSIRKPGSTSTVNCVEKVLSSVIEEMEMAASQVQTFNFQDQQH
jgi:hypothetical protein